MTQINETMRQWARKFSQQFANQIRRSLPAGCRPPSNRPALRLPEGQPRMRGQIWIGAPGQNYIGGKHEIVINDNNVLPTERPRPQSKLTPTNDVRKGSN